MTVLEQERVATLVAISEGRAALRAGRVRELRQRAGLSQRELAQALDVSPAAVSRWEAGERVPRGRAAERLRALLDVLERAA